MVLCAHKSLAGRGSIWRCHRLPHRFWPTTAQRRWGAACAVERRGYLESLARRESSRLSLRGLVREACPRPGLSGGGPVACAGSSIVCVVRCRWLGCATGASGVRSGRLRLEFGIEAARASGRLSFFKFLTVCSHSSMRATGPGVALWRAAIACVRARLLLFERPDSSHHKCRTTDRLNRNSDSSPHRAKVWWARPRGHVESGGHVERVAGVVEGQERRNSNKCHLDGTTPARTRHKHPATSARDQSPLMPARASNMSPSHLRHPPSHKIFLVAHRNDDCSSI